MLMGPLPFATTTFEPDLLQRYDVSLGGLDREERRDGNSEKYER